MLAFRERLRLCANTRRVLWWGCCDLRPHPPLRKLTKITLTRQIHFKWGQKRCEINVTWSWFAHSRTHDEFFGGFGLFCEHVDYKKDWISPDLYFKVEQCFSTALIILGNTYTGYARDDMQPNNCLFLHSFLSLSLYLYLYGQPTSKSVCESSKTWGFCVCLGWNIAVLGEIGPWLALHWGPAALLFFVFFSSVGCYRADPHVLLRRFKEFHGFWERKRAAAHALL